ncbi:hypothetical protein [Mycoplasma procyoni]|uniref:hypothetical protein n=1 Tax=Mycoplasma procyoni TaxID=568784 RepID=UPI00197C8AFE|nr:hypothetical protein [Mycoplasma procyoni]MBN3534910.1 hypothetical protein [Mycoplasma procyoni]
MIEKYSFKYIRSLKIYRLSLIWIHSLLAILILLQGLFIGWRSTYNFFGWKVPFTIWLIVSITTFVIVALLFIVHVINNRKFAKIALMIINDQVSSKTEQDFKKDFKGFILFKAVSDEKIKKWKSTLSEEQKAKVLEDAKDPSKVPVVKKIWWFK